MDWKNIPVPAGLVIALLTAAWFTLGWTDERYLLVMNYQQDRWFDRQVQVSKEARSLDADVRELESKKRFAPATFDAQDKDRLELKRKQLDEVEKQLKTIEQQLQK